MVSAHAVIEVVASRYVDPEAVSKLERVADQLINSLLVVGPSCPDWQSLPLTALPLEVRVQGHPVFQGRGGHPQGDPLIPLVWLANHLSSYGRGLRAGELVTTGSCCGVQFVAPEQTATAHFPGLGSAVVAFLLVSGTAGGDGGRCSFQRRWVHAQSSGDSLTSASTRAA